jgi:hypothetical protein
VQQAICRPALVVVFGRATTLQLILLQIFVADGYGNRRVAVFDSETWAYKRHSGE